MTKQDDQDNDIRQILADMQTGLSEMLMDFRNETNRKLDRLEARMERSESRMDRLEMNQTRLQGHVLDIGTRQDELMKKADQTLNVLDGIAARLDDDDVERAALTAQMNRHEDWIVEAAPLVRVDYTPGS